MGSSQLVASSSEFGTLIAHLIEPADKKARDFLGWWQRMHRRPVGLVVVALKFIEWVDDGATAQRFVWEVCQWPQGRKGRASEWTFVCWMIDGDGMWMKPFSSKCAAQAYFRQPATVVMTRSAQTTTDQLIR